MNKKVAAVDVDGVLLDCDGAFAIVASHLLGVPLPKLNTSYDLGKRYGITDLEVFEVFEYMKTHPQGWSKMPAIDGAIDAVIKLQNSGWDIQLVTAIKEDLKEMRLESLHHHGFVPDGIHCVGHHLASKSEVIKSIGAELIIDDRLKHIHESSFVKTKVWVDHGDEQDGLTCPNSTIKVNSLKEFVDGFCPLNNKKAYRP